MLGLLLYGCMCIAFTVEPDSWTARHMAGRLVSFDVLTENIFLVHQHMWGLNTYLFF